MGNNNTFYGDGMHKNNRSPRICPHTKCPVEGNILTTLRQQLFVLLVVSIDTSDSNYKREDCGIRHNRRTPTRCDDTLDVSDCSLRHYN